MSELQKFFRGIPKVMQCKKQMVERNLTRAKAHCPICEGRNTLQLALTPNRRDKLGFHARWRCQCGFSGME